ncbi:hypothetical protein Tsubulata_035974 [Turnera subulata]|uniref:Chromo domain-containing protein n=1 Tax=Turnera subulata TaxID=218843 RepID=A0A9Q0EXL8_9ROSI|nr:hypothetical protein Tsubulata_035974 [Turnera subulata]
MILQPAEVLDTRVLQENDARVEEWLIRWEGLPSSAATWENKADLCRKYPSMNLEDKVQSGDGESELILSKPMRAEQLPLILVPQKSAYLRTSIHRVQAGTCVCVPEFDGPVGPTSSRSQKIALERTPGKGFDSRSVLFKPVKPVGG